MKIEEYFDEVQNIIKTLDKTNNIKDIVKKLNSDNIQSIVNQNFNSKVSAEETAKSLYDAISKESVDQTTPDTLSGDRTMNTMERRVMNYKTFINENSYRNEVINQKPTYQPNTTRKLNITEIINNGDKFERKFFNWLKDENIEWHQSGSNLNFIEIIDKSNIKKIKDYWKELN